jgi:hypothetical protein
MYLMGYEMNDRQYMYLAAYYNYIEWNVFCRNSVLLLLVMVMHKLDLTFDIWLGTHQGKDVVGVLHQFYPIFTLA